ncbi:MAG: hypothetical protein ACW960_01805 [Candidatus Thorarchaeota archaeon]|jgi:hypothetical protein
MKFQKSLSILFLVILASPIIAASPLIAHSGDAGTNQLSPLQNTEPAEGLLLDPPSILVYTEFADQNPGEELENTMKAINNTFGTNYAYSNLVNYTFLDTELPGNDILLIPEQENADIAKMKTVGQAWASPLTDFVNSGGVVILLDFGNASAPGLGLHIYNESSLMQFGPVLGQYPSAALMEMNRITFGDALGRQVKYRWVPRNHTFAVATTDGTNAFADYDTDSPVCVHKTMGRGHVVFLGFDLSDPGPYYEQIVGNAIRLPNHVVFDYSQQSEYTWLNERQDQFYNDDHPAIAFVEDLVEAGFAVSRMDTLDAAFLNASEVVVCPLPKQYIDDYDAGEIAILDAYVANGGSIFLQSDWTTYGDDIRNLVNNFGYDWGRDILWDTDDAMNWYYESQTAYTDDNILSHQITHNVSRVEFYASDGFTTLPANAERIIVTDWDGTNCWGEGGWLDNWLGADGTTLMAVSTYGAGKVSVVLDGNFMDCTSYPLDEDQDNDGVINYFDSDNDVLLVNTIHWLAGAVPANDVPLLSGLTHAPSSPVHSDPMTVNITATDSDGLANITCYYRDNLGTWQTVSMTPIGGDLYSAPIGNFNASAEKEYYVRAFDSSADEMESVSSVVYLNGINYFPSTPGLQNPGNSDDDGVFLLNWTASTDPDGVIDHYAIQISDNSRFTSILDEVTAFTDERIITVFDNDTYYFRVRAVDDDGIGGFWCFPQSINVVIVQDLTGPTISAPILSPIAPVHGDSVTVSANVTDPRNIKNVTCYYRIDSGPWESEVMTRGVGDEYSCSIGVLLVDNVVEYYIVAFDNSTQYNDATTSTYMYITHNQSPSAPILINPGTTISTDHLVLNWTAAYDLEMAIDRYEIQMSATSDFTLILAEWNVTSTDKELTGLSDGVYHIRVRAVDDHDAVSPWSNAESFTVALSTGNGTSPTTTTTTTPNPFDPDVLNLVLLVFAGGFTFIIVMVVANYLRQRSSRKYQF